MSLKPFHRLILILMWLEGNGFLQQGDRVFSAAPIFYSNHELFIFCSLPILESECSLAISLELITNLMDGDCHA